MKTAKGEQFKKPEYCTLPCSPFLQLQVLFMIQVRVHMACVYRDWGNGSCYSSVLFFKILLHDIVKKASKFNKVLEFTKIQTRRKSKKTHLDKIGKKSCGS